MTPCPVVNTAPAPSRRSGSGYWGSQPSAPAALTLTREERHRLLGQEVDGDVVERSTVVLMLRIMLQIWRQVGRTSSLGTRRGTRHPDRSSDRLLDLLEHSPRSRRSRYLAGSARGQAMRATRVQLLSGADRATGTSPQQLCDAAPLERHSRSCEPSRSASAISTRSAPGTSLWGEQVGPQVVARVIAARNCGNRQNASRPKQEHECTG